MAFGLDDAIALGTLAVNVFNSGQNWWFSNRSNKRSDEQLQIQKDSYNETLRSNYYSYMQKLEAMNDEYNQDRTAINQERENIASNQNYLDRWAGEYDLSMQSAVDEGFSQYQQLASNYASGLVSNGETGRRGGTAGRAVGDAGIALSAYNGGSTSGFNLTGSRLGAYLSSTAMDMMSDRQTALSAVGTSYKAIDSYQQAMNMLSNSEVTGIIDSMNATTDQIKEELKKKEIEV